MNRKGYYGANVCTIVVALILLASFFPALGYSTEPTPLLQPEVKQREIQVSKVKAQHGWISRKKKEQSAMQFYMGGPLSKATPENEPLLEAVEEPAKDVTKVFKKGYKGNLLEDGPDIEVLDV